MSKILIFAGTTEGRELAGILSKENIECIVCLATEYGNEVMPDLPGVIKKTGRLDAEQMKVLIDEEKIEVVVDATHPFATLVSDNIKKACQKTDRKYLRLKRETSRNSENEVESSIKVFDNSESCVKALERTTGNILLTTGSKELAKYCQSEQIKDRLFVRVLPGEESLAICAKNGINKSHIIAMQGPFSVKLNEALIEQFDIKYLVTKESGRAGGLDEKIIAANNCKIETYLIGSPDKAEGISIEQVVEELGIIRQKKNYIDISLIGIGMGNQETLTCQAQRVIYNADYIIGSKRIIEPFSPRIEKKDIYLPDDIAEYIKGKSGNVSILFSGDSGFYSGCSKVYEKLTKLGYSNIKIYPGISAISYLASKTGIPWSEAEIFSLHGNLNIPKWKGQLSEKVKDNERIFLLLSGIDDVYHIAECMSNSGLEVKLYIGINMSYEDEKIVCTSPQELLLQQHIEHSQIEMKTRGLYTCIIVNESPRKKAIMNTHKDEEFIRGKVPMTKEEVRTISISKLNLTSDSIVWDVGSGTGSIAVEIAGYSPDIEVYAVEHKAEAAGLIKQNSDKFRVSNVHVIEGKAPQALAELPSPSHVFIGGSGGELLDILNVIYKKNPQARVVINAISLETIAQVTQLIPTLNIKDFEAVNISVSKSRNVGSYNLMQAENPVMVFSFNFQK